MKIKEVTKPFTLLEANMSPGFLAKEAAKINATVGIEFEMYVPDIDVSDIDSDNYLEEVSSISVTDIRSILDFYVNDVNSAADINKLKLILTKTFNEWKNTTWEESQAVLLKDALILSGDYEFKQELILKSLPTSSFSDEEKEQISTLLADPEVHDYKIDNILRTALRKNSAFFDKVIDEQIENNGEIYEIAQGEFLDTAEEQYITDHLDGPDMEDIHRSIRRQYGRNFNIYWPMEASENSSSDVTDSLSSLARSFSKASGFNVNYSTEYHGRRKPDTWIIEPDGSLGNESGGLEFVSPPMPLNDMQKAMTSIISWANNYGCTTDESTGLHMNVSIPGMVTNSGDANLDYVKLALFLGDEHILNQFDRISNTYCKSAFFKVKNKAESMSATAVAQFFKNFNNKLNKASGNIIHSLITDKYTSIHVHSNEGYVEFRSPGGDWLNTNFTMLESTLNRFVVALSIASDPNSHRQEYAKKLSKLFSNTNDNDLNNISNWFAQYRAGTVDVNSLKDALIRKHGNVAAKKISSDGKPIYWQLIDRAGTYFQTPRKIPAFNAREAIIKSMIIDGGYSYQSGEWVADNNALIVKPYAEIPNNERALMQPFPTTNDEFMKMSQALWDKYGDSVEVKRRFYYGQRE